MVNWFTMGDLKIPEFRTALFMIICFVWLVISYFVYIFLNFGLWGVFYIICGMLFISWFWGLVGLTNNKYG